MRPMECRKAALKKAHSARHKSLVQILEAQLGPGGKPERIQMLCNPET